MSECNGKRLVALRKWQAELGISRTTAYRLRRRGWLHVVIIAGKPYVSGEELDRFLSRAKAGEFAHAPKNTTK